MAQQSEDLVALDRRSGRLEEAMGSQVADPLKRGMDARSVQAATSELEVDLERQRSHRQRLVAWTEAHLNQSAKARRLELFAAQAARSLGDTSPEAKLRIIGLLDINVRITDWVTCATCDGKGIVPRTELPGRRGCPVDACSECRRHRYIPVIETSGVVSPAKEGGTEATIEVLFTLRSTG